MIPRGLVIAMSIGVIASVIFGLIFVDLKKPNELNFVEGSSLTILTEKKDFDKGEKIKNYTSYNSDAHCNNKSSWNQNTNPIFLIF